LNLLGLRASKGGPLLLASATDPPSLSEYVEILAEHRLSAWAWGHYKDVLADLLRIRNAKRIMEIGAGRSPLFDRAEIEFSEAEYIINDVQPSELARAPGDVARVCFDIASTSATEIDTLANTVDLVFSKMVLEHVSDAQQAYKNIYKLLSPSGVCLNFHPVLFSLPFLMNYLAPVGPTEWLVGKFSPNRSREGQPKFPARYDRCRISKSVRSTLQLIGYRDVWQVPFWFHEYFKDIPGLHQCHLLFDKIAARANWTALASYCYTIAVK